MPLVPASLPFYPDARGNRLEGWTVQPRDVGHFLWLRGTDEMVTQVQHLAPEYQQVTISAPWRGGWTHSFYSQFSLRSEIVSLLDLLKTIITLPALPGIAAVLVLDWYKVPQEDIDPHSWANTTLGDCIRRGKYWYRSNPEQQRNAGLEISASICRTVADHPHLKRAEYVVDVPGHDSSQVSFGSRLAATVARDSQKPLVKVGTRSAFRPEAKNLTFTQRAEALQNEFFLTGSLTGARVLIVDDVVRTGSSLAEVARASLAAGARMVYGICAVRTMRK